MSTSTRFQRACGSIFHEHSQRFCNDKCAMGCSKIKLNNVKKPQIPLRSSLLQKIRQRKFFGRCASFICEHCLEQCKTTVEESERKETAHEITEFFLGELERVEEVRVQQERPSTLDNLLATSDPAKWIAETFPPDSRLLMCFRRIFGVDEEPNDQNKIYLIRMASALDLMLTTRKENAANNKSIKSNNQAMEAPFLMRLLAASVTSSYQAGHIIRQVMDSGHLGVVEKGKNDLQTEADRSAQLRIIGGLSKHFPSLRIIGEETMDPKELEHHVSSFEAPVLDSEVLRHACPKEFAHLGPKDVTVWVDPLDGTSEFTQGLLEHVTVLIGVSHANRPIAGVVYQPYYEREEAQKGQGRCIWALKHLGAFGIEQKSPPEGQCIVATTRSHGTKAIDDSVEACKPSQVLRVGGCGHKVLLLVEGKAHVYVFPSHGCKKWDTCAPEILLECVGGKMLDMHGLELQYDPDAATYSNRAGVIATAEEKRLPHFVDCIPQWVKDELK